MKYKILEKNTNVPNVNGFLGTFLVFCIHKFQNNDHMNKMNAFYVAKFLRMNRVAVQIGDRIAYRM